MNIAMLYADQSSRAAAVGFNGPAGKRTLPSQWMAGHNTAVESIVVRWKNKVLASLAVASLIKKQLGLLSQGKRTRPGMSPLMALISSQLKSRRQAKRYRQWIDNA